MIESLTHSSNAKFQKVLAHHPLISARNFPYETRETRPLTDTPPNFHRVGASQASDNGREQKPKPYEVGVQSSCGVCSQVPCVKRFGELRRHSGGIILVIGQRERESDRGGAFVVRPRADDDSHSAEVRGIAGDRVHQGEKRDSLGKGVRRAEAEFCRQSFWARGYFVSTVPACSRGPRRGSARWSD